MQTRRLLMKCGLCLVSPVHASSAQSTARLRVRVRYCIFLGPRSLARRLLIFDTSRVWVRFSASASASSLPVGLEKVWGYRILFLPFLQSLSDEHALRGQNPQLAAELCLLTAMAASSPDEQAGSILVCTFKDKAVVRTGRLTT